MVGFLRPLATTSGWTTVPTCYCNSEIQDGVQDGRNNLILPYYHRLLYRDVPIAASPHSSVETTRASAAAGDDNWNE